MKRMRVGLAAAAAAVAMYVAAPAAACGIDGVPSLSGNGTLAHRNPERTTPGSLNRWAPFVFTAPYRAGEKVTFKENLADLRKSLLPQAFGRPWLWHFGDGTTIQGVTVEHTYRRAGEYKVELYAYYSSLKGWYLFDDALLHVR